MAFATVEGTVDFIKNGGKGFTVIESWTSQGRESKRRWAVWFEDQTTLELGSTVKLTGILGGKIGDPWTKDGVEHPGGVEWAINKARFVNSPEIVAHEPNSPAGAPDDAWSAPAYDDSSTPF